MKTIFCHNCNKVIGKIQILPNDRVKYIEEDGILGMRKRLDGQWGIECMCGNDSRIAKLEEGLISSKPPTKAALATIQKRKNQTKYKTRVTESPEGIACDGFTIG